MMSGTYGCCGRSETVQRKIKYEDADWRADFDTVRLDQMLRFRALPLRDKLQAMEDMAELVDQLKRMRERSKAKSDKP